MTDNPNNDEKAATDSSEDDAVPFPDDHRDCDPSGEVGPNHGVILYSFGKNKIAVIKAIREVIKGNSLPDAIKLVEAAPVIIAERISGAIAKNIGERLEDAGATAMVILRPSAFQPDDKAESLTAYTEEGDYKDPRFNVILYSVGKNKIPVIKATRGAFMGLGLADAKKIVEAAPVTVAERISRASAEAIRDTLENAGALVLIDPLPPAIPPARLGDSSILRTFFIEVLIDRFEVLVEVVNRRLEAFAGNDDRPATDSPARDALNADPAMKSVAHLLDHLGEVSSSCDVILEYRDCHPVSCAKAIRMHVSGLGLSDAAAMAQSAPCVVMENASRDAAEDLKTALEGAGATVSIRGSFSPSDKVQINETIKRLGDPSVDVSLSDLKSLSEAINDGTMDPSEVFQLIEYKFLEGIEAELKGLTERLQANSTSTTA